MVEQCIDMWACPTAKYRVITTNGTIKKNGECVMGRGCAYEAKTLFPHIPAVLGRLLKMHGNHVFLLTNDLLSFPVKHNWWEKADLELIKQSLKELKRYARTFSDDFFLLPRPGCGNGGLDWHKEVKPLVIAADLPDNVIVCYK